MTLNKPRTAGQWLLLVSPTFIIIASVALGFITERALPRGGYTALLTALIGIVPALMLSISAGCWLIRVAANDEFGRAVKGGLLGLGLLAVNFLIALPACILVGKLMR
jgi:hypothetical protein